VRGAFTGATNPRTWLLAIAGLGGTVFLDEIGELPVDLQAKLYTGDSGEGDSSGGKREPFPSNVRILAATNRDLERAVSEGTFRRGSFFPAECVDPRGFRRCASAGRTFRCWWMHILERIGRDARAEKKISDDGAEGTPELRLARQRARTGRTRWRRACRAQQRPRNSAARSSHPDLQRAPRLDGGEPTGEWHPCPWRSWRNRNTILNALAQVNGDKMLAARRLGIGKTTLYPQIERVRVPKLICNL